MESTSSRLLLLPSAIPVPISAHNFSALRLTKTHVCNHAMSDLRSLWGKKFESIQHMFVRKRDGLFSISLN